MKKRIAYIIILLILFLSFLLISISSYANTISSDLKDNFFRLHIIANSNSQEDQNLKLKIRDALLEYMSQNVSSSMSKNDVILVTQENLNTIKNIAHSIIKEEGFHYSVNALIGNFYFPTKYYGNISLPAGYYDSLKIEIGEAQGNNWWCSLFPPLCFVDISSGVIDEDSQTGLKENLNNEEFAIITSNSKPIKLKFKLVELLSK